MSEQNATARRSLYLLQRRHYNPTFLAVLDKPTVTRGVCQRDYSATVQQSLTLLNDRFLIEHAERCARRLEPDAGVELSEAVDTVYRLVLSRLPDEGERTWCGEFLSEQMTLHQQAGQSAEESRRKSLAALCQVLWGSNEFLYLP